MSRRTWRTALAAVAVIAGTDARAQDPTDGVRAPTSPRLDLPFATDPDRISGPPRAMGEVPVGESQPPSTLPGRVQGEPPRAMGESPLLPQVFPPVGPTLPRVPLGVLAPDSNGPMSLAPGMRFVPPVPLRTPDAPGGRPGERGRDVPRVNTEPTPDAAGAPPLALEEVLATAERGYPPFLAVLQERMEVRGELLAAEGAFDTNLNADSRNWPYGFYNRNLQSVFLQQPLKDLGGKVFGGYRLAEGKWPVYYNYLNTLSGGAFVFGLELPLLRNRAIDAKRAKLMQTEIERRKVEPLVAKQRIELFKNASKAYWNWVAAGRAAEIYAELVRVAEMRNAGLETQMREGLVRPIDLVDFRKVLIQRQQQEVAARRRREQTAIELSLYLRDSCGLPMIPPAVRLPTGDPAVPPLDDRRFTEDLDIALRLRPEILSVRYQVKKAQVERQFAQNQLQPSLTFYFYNEKNIGDRRADLYGDFRPYIMEASLLLDVPLQRRAAKGRIISADAVLRQLAAEGQFTCEKVRADVLDGQSALRASYELLDRAREGRRVSQRLEDAERVLLREGTSNILFLNLREQATSDARVYVIEAEAKYLATLAEYRATLGVDALNPDPAAPVAAPPASRPGHH